MTKTIKLTAKRQATFPAEVCEQLGLRPGDEIELVPRVEAGGRFWVIQKREAPTRPWVGSLRGYGQNASDHSLDAIRNSIATKRKSGK